MLGKLDATAEVDGGAINLDGVTAFANLQYVHGRALSEELVGDAQVVSSLEAPSALRVLEAWVEAPLADVAFVKAGLIDLNSEFDIQAVGGLFLNSSHGIGPDFSQSGLNGPSIFPTTSPALTVRAQHDGWTAHLGAFDAVPGDPDRPKRTRIRFPGKQGALAVFEIERAIGDASAIKAGAWTYSDRFDSLAEPARRSGNRGAYATVEGRLAGADESGSLDGWVRVGIAEARINPIETYVGGGITWGGDARRLGFAVAHARLGEPAIAAGLAENTRLHRAETNFELTYSKRITPWLTLQPDAQYVINPSWRRDVGDALVVGVRLTFETP